MQNHKKFFAIVLAMLLIIPLVLCACEQTQSSTNSDNINSDISSNLNDDDWAAFTEDTGLNYKNWSENNAPVTVKVLSYQEDLEYFNREISSNSVKADEYSGEAIYEAVVERTNRIEQDFGIKIEAYYTSDSHLDDWLAINTAAGISEYQIVADALLNMTAAAKNGNLYELKRLNIDFSKDFWDQTAVSDLSIDNKLFFVTGDLFISDNQVTWACFFNKDIIDEITLHRLTILWQTTNGR